MPNISGIDSVPLFTEACDGGGEKARDEKKLEKQKGGWGRWWGCKEKRLLELLKAHLLINAFCHPFSVLLLPCYI